MDTHHQRIAPLWDRLAEMKILFETLDCPEPLATDQQEIHAFLDTLEHWMDAVEAWDRAGMERARLESLQGFLEDVS